MRMYDIIDKKKNKEKLTKEEIEFFVKGYTDGSIPDYQAAALLMAICINGMDKEETVQLTLAMADSGERLDLSDIPGAKLDKHSTGGIGDKTTLIVGPITAALGVKIAKMSGRGLGATGGTIDKLDSIPGFSSDLSDEAFKRQLLDIGMVDAAQTLNLAPADKKLYQLRDVTATVDCIPLIASSIMSKKLVSGADSIILDVKCGSGAFMKNYEEAVLLAETMVDIGKMAGRRTLAVISDMNEPLGKTVGNSLEVLEAVEVLKGSGEERLLTLCRELSAGMLVMSGMLGEADPGNEALLDKARSLVDETIVSGKALNKFREFVRAQGGDDSFIDDRNILSKAVLKRDVVCDKEGYLSNCDAEEVGNVSCLLGAGRLTKEDSIDSSAGIIIHKKLGDRIKTGELLATLYTNNEDVIETAAERLAAAYCVSSSPIDKKSVIMGVVS